MSAASDKFEQEVASIINSYNIPNLKAERPNVSTKYSDVRISYNNAYKCWVEVKMNPSDNLGNPRLSFLNGKFISCGIVLNGGDATLKNTDEQKPLAEAICNCINKDQNVYKWLNELCNYYNEKYAKILQTPEAKVNNIILYTSTSDSFYKKKINNAIVITPQVLVNFINEKHPGNQYIYKNNTYDVSAIVQKHYISGKAEPAYFLQCGKDKMFKLYETDSQLNNDTRNIINKFPKFKSLPLLKGNGIFNLRISFRGGNTQNTVRAYEIQPEVKITSYTSYSSYSLFSTDKNKNPLL